MIYIFRTIIAIPVILCVLAFILDLFVDNSSPNTSLIEKVFHCFSPISNTRALFAISNENGKNDQFQFVHGIRTIGSILVMCGHAICLLSLTVTNINTYARFPIDLQNISRMLISQPFYNGGLLVHTFFIIRYFLYLICACPHYCTISQIVLPCWKNDSWVVLDDWTRPVFLFCTFCNLSLIVQRCCRAKLAPIVMDNYNLNIHFLRILIIVSNFVFI